MYVCLLPEYTYRKHSYVLPPIEPASKDCSIQDHLLRLCNGDNRLTHDILMMCVLPCYIALIPDQLSISFK